MSLEIRKVQCPFCGESIEIEFELLQDPQTFIEDCTVCCRPIEYTIVPGLEGPEITASRSD